jgi:DNA-directed RNA polymerase specialized sigma24 family protein
LCDAYYEPVVAYLRMVLRDADAARELSHAFFAEMLGGGTIHSAERGRGRFRSYLLGAVKHFVANQRDAARRLKRGGGVAAVALDDPEAHSVPDMRISSPDAEFDKQWAVTVLERGMASLRAECLAEGRVDFFENVRPLLTGDSTYGDQGSIAALCGMKVEAFRVALHRLKKRLRKCVKDEVAGTLDDPDSVQDEMQTLFAALCG